MSSQKTLDTFFDQKGKDAANQQENVNKSEDRDTIMVEATSPIRPGSVHGREQEHDTPNKSDKKKQKTDGSGHAAAQAPLGNQVTPPPPPNELATDVLE